MSGLDVGIYHTALTLFKAYNLYGIELLLLHITLDAYLLTTYILGRDIIGTITSNGCVGHIHLNPVGIAIIIELLRCSHVVAILEDKAILYESRSRLDLHLQRLPIVGLMILQGSTCSQFNIAIELRCGNRYFITMHIKHDINVSTTIRNNR